MSSRTLIALLLVAVAGTAHADNKWDFGFSFGGNFQTIGGEGYSGGVLQIQLARRITSRIGVAASGELAYALAGEEVKGGIVRGMAGVDIHVLRARKDFYPQLVVGTGTGTETVMWDRGTLTRPASYLGVEFRQTFEIRSGGFFRNLSALGMRFGVRMLLAPGVPQDTVVKLCSACERMESPPERGLDIGVAFYMGLLFGR